MRSLRRSTCITHACLYAPYVDVHHKSTMSLSAGDAPATTPELPSRKEDVVVHLVFSDGGAKDAWELYSMALFPFAFGIDTEHVYLTATKRVAGKVEDVVDGWRGVIEQNFTSSARPENDAEYFPPGYHEYFTEIYRSRTTGFDAMSSVPPCTIRVVSGRGFPATRRYVMRTVTVDKHRMNISFTDLPGSPSALSIFDICGSQYGAAVVFGHFASNANRKFTQRQEKVAESTAPFACENADLTYAFRVGADGDHVNPPEAEEDSLSCAFGDAVVCSILAAAKRFADNSMEGDNLDALFTDRYRNLNTHYLDLPGFRHQLNPASNLGRLQTLMEQGVLSLNTAAFEGSLFARQDEWFLTRARTDHSTTSSDMRLPVVLNELLVDFVVTSLQLWHHTHPTEAEHCELMAEKHWSTLSDLLGPRLRRVNLDWDDDKQILSRSDDGMPIGAWAMACRDLAGITKHVTNKVLSGSWDDNEGPSEWDESSTEEPEHGEGGEPN